MPRATRPKLSELQPQPGSQGEAHSQHTQTRRGRVAEVEENEEPDEDEEMEDTEFGTGAKVSPSVRLPIYSIFSVIRR